MNEILVGSKWYRTIDKETCVLRILKANNEKLTVVLEDGNKYNINKDELVNRYIPLRPHAKLIVTTVSVSNTDDVVTTLFRPEDEEDNLPFCVCRQNIEDFFLNKTLLMNKAYKGDIYYLGCSVSKLTCPSDIDYRISLACDKIKQSEAIAIYMDDKFEDILNLIRKKKTYDTIISAFHDSIMKTDKFKTDSKTYKELLLNTKFMSDVVSAFSIKVIPMPMNFNVNTLQLDYDIKCILENFLNIKMGATYVSKYDYNVDLTKIQRDYILVKDINEELFVVGYDSLGYLRSAE